ncbi:hypothetical protein VE02_00450 [Pseudogymnoascus sp. 03VT05]|nr:hypothetical protein VE02_00450 [Pseudogymnoascus sp. 03VT05]
MAQELPSSLPTQSSMKRAVTLPLRPSTSSNWTQREKPASSESIESLYIHPSVRIVSFESFGSSSVFQRRSSLNTPNLADVEEEVGTLPWSSTFERTIAVGPLRIYRAPGSVAFINCSSVIQPVLPKSRCWCVDDDATKFILQIRRPQFWRIEVPLDDPNHKAKSQELKDVLSQILLFEKTPCPFSRSFHIELPEPPQTPVKKKPWKPVERPSSANTDTRSVNTEVASMEISPKSGKTEDYYAAAASDDHPAVPEMDTDSDATDDTNITPRNYFPRAAIPHIFKLEPLSRPEILDTGRSVTAPPQLTLMTSPPSKNKKGLSLGSPVGRKSEDSTLSNFSSSQDSFHTVQSWHSPITPIFPASSDSRPSTPTTYPYPHDNIKLPKRTPEPQSVSELTNSPNSETPNTPGVWTMVDTPETKLSGSLLQSSPPSPTTPTPAHKIQEDHDEEEVYEDASPSAEVVVADTRKHRSVSERSSSRRALSPLPSPANLFSPSLSRARHLRTARHLPTAIIQKTWEILMSPPSHLVQIMVEIAAKIKAGQWRGAVFGVDEGGEEVVGQWDYGDGDFMCDQWDDADVDDYGTKTPVSSQMVRHKAVKGPPGGFGDSWEID